MNLLVQYQEKSIDFYFAADFRFVILSNMFPRTEFIDPIGIELYETRK